VEPPTSVLIGQRYRDLEQGVLGRLGKTWTVKALLRASDGFEYAQLVSDFDPTQQKTLAVSVLADARRFERLAT
jgi:hypothetical protein